MFFQQRTTGLIVMKLVLLLTIARRADGSLLLNLCLPPSLTLLPLSLPLSSASWWWPTLQNFDQDFELRKWERNIQWTIFHLQTTLRGTHCVQRRSQWVERFSFLKKLRRLWQCQEDLKSADIEYRWVQNGVRRLFILSFWTTRRKKLTFKISVVSKQKNCESHYIHWTHK